MCIFLLILAVITGSYFFAGMETGLMFNCDSCSFRSVRKDNYLAHVAEHKNESYPTNRHRKRNSPKPQVGYRGLSVIVITKIVCDAEWVLRNEQNKQLWAKLINPTFLLHRFLVLQILYY
jgi:hypothetical protein